jgi:hypothetical protein
MSASPGLPLKSAEDGEFDRQCRVEFDPITDPALRNAKDLRHCGTREHLAAANEIVIGPIAEDHIESDLVDVGFLLRIVSAISNSRFVAIRSRPR